jgi:hypothetical protein
VTVLNIYFKRSANISKTIFMQAWKGFSGKLERAEFFRIPVVTRHTQMIFYKRIIKGW